jgi:hypothetical protein
MNYCQASSTGDLFSIIEKIAAHKVGINKGHLFCGF